MAADFDVAIVGGGPAGATLARLLGPELRVALIDREREDGGWRKPCGGLLSGDAQQALAKFDMVLGKELLVDPQIFAVKTIDAGSGLIRYYQRFYINLDRDRFDRWLLALTPQRVVRCQGRCLSVERRDEGFTLGWRDATGAEQVISARMVVGADGADSLVRRSLFPGRQVRRYVAIQQWFAEQHSQPFYSCVFDPETSDCCSWSISKDNYFIYGGAFPARGCRAAFERQKRTMERFGFRFGPPLRSEACLVLRPRRWQDLLPGGDGAFLLGEAAGMISSSSLEGISYAVNSARQLAQAFRQGQGEPGAVLRHYRRNSLGLRLKLMLKVVKSPFLYHPFLRYLVMKSGIKSIRVEQSDP